jgi:2-haloacid dehalogenase
MAALPLIVFDVNETLLDLGTMEPTFERIFGEKDAVRLWFANLVLYSVVLTLADSYVSFTDIGSAVMKMLADTRGIKIKIWIGEEMKKIMRHRSDRDIAKFQRSDPWMLPIPATFIVGRRTLR